MIVISRGIGLAVFGVVIAVLFYLAWFRKAEKPIVISKYLQSSWEEYIADCGA